MPHDTEFELFRDSYRRFLKEQVAPYYEQWEHDGLIPRDLWLRLGENGFCASMYPRNMAAMVLLFITPSCWFKKQLKRALRLWQLPLAGKMSWSLLICKISDPKSKTLLVTENGDR